MSIHRALAALVAGASLALPGGTASADMVTLGGSQDNTLYEDPGGALSNGAGEHFFTGRTNQPLLRRGLIAFDVAGSIPAGSTINSVTLTLRVSRSQAGSTAVSLHRVLSDWGEGSSVASGQEGEGANATAGDATWIHTSYPSEFWAAAGGDFASTASATTTVGGNGAYTWSSAGMVADVAAWLADPDDNYGWIVIGNEAVNQTAKRFDSRENAKTQNRPVLTVDFTPTAPTGACCAADGTCSVVLDPGTSCSGTYQGAGSVCEPNPCPESDGACCLPDAAATCLEVTESTCTAQGGTYQGALTTCAATLCPVVLEPFVDALPIPAVAQPVSGAPGGVASYQLAMREVQQQLHRDLPPTTVWGFGDGASGATYPGPTIEARMSQPVTVTWINDLRDTGGGGALRSQHYLPVDTCPHGADDQSPRTVVHLHGAHVAAAFDGYPEATFLPGSQVVYSYPNWQLPGTLWYHDHALGITRLNVYMGLAGLYLIRDAFEDSLGLPSGEFEIPLAIQDRTFNPDGSLQYPATWQDLFFGDTILVNGKVWPFLNVKQGKYRFRVLGGSGSRTYRLTFFDTTNPTQPIDFQQIGAEGGLIPAPVTLDDITLGSGERADLIVDFAPFPAGTEILLQNSAPAPFPGDPGVGVIPDVMKFVVTNEPGHTDPLPATLRPMEVLHEADATVFRDFELEKGPGDACSPFVWEVVSVVDGSPVGSRWDDVTEFPELGATEVWRFVNKSGMTHPMHMHLVMFQVLDRQAFDLIGGEVVPIGNPVPPPPQEAGWKDTVQVGPNEIVRVIARFENYEGLYAYHCHILEHEDHEMMRQFQTGSSVAACQNGLDDDGDGKIDFAGADPGCASATDVSERAPTLPCDDGLDNDGDGLVDYAASGGDPGCGNPGSLREDPQCQNGLDDDGDGKIDFDRGVSVLGPGSPDLSAEPDESCIGKPFHNRERAARRCGLGAELCLLLAAGAWLHRRRRSAIRR